MSARIFHLSIPVADLETAIEFYVGVLGGRAGRLTDEWADVLIWGHQVTLQATPDEVLPAALQGKRHFGIILPWDEWYSYAELLRLKGAAFLSKPEVHHRGTRKEQAKFYLADPSNNVIEIKAYRDVDHTVGVGRAL